MVEDALKTPYASKICDKVLVKPINKYDALLDDVSFKTNDKIIFILFSNFDFLIELSSIQSLI